MGNRTFANSDNYRNRPIYFQFFGVLLSPILSSNPASKETNDIMEQVMSLLESPMESMVQNLKRIYDSDAADEVEWELDCDLKAMLCHNDALMASLPF